MRWGPNSLQDRADASANLDRITSESFSDGTHAIAIGYDANGNLSSRSDASGSTSWLYDAANRLRSKTLPGGAQLGYVYDAVGNMTSSTDPGGTTGYHYDKDNELDQISEPGSGRTDIFGYDADHNLIDTWTATNAGVTYDAAGNIVLAPTGFASHIHRTYNSADELTEIATTRTSSDAPANRLADISYSYVVPSGTACSGASVGMVTNKRQRSTDVLTNKTTDYCYDSAGRLTSAITSGGPTYTYGYDKDSNRVTDAAGTHTFNAANQLTDPGVTYDADGNLTVSSAYPTLTYNGIDQTTAITPAGQASVPFGYGGTGQAERTSAGTTTAQNGALGVQTETTGGATTSYVSGPGGKLVERTPGGDFYYYFDGLGSVIGVVDPSGAQRAAYTYDPYGSNATATGVNGALPANPWRWAGGYLDATGLYHFGARYYDPAVGRFTQRDPLGDGYVYGSDDPSNRFDPSGLADFQPIADLEELCGFGEGYHPNDIDSQKCVRYRNARVTGIASYYYSGSAGPQPSDFDRAVKDIRDFDYGRAHEYADYCVEFAEVGAKAGAERGPGGALVGGAGGCLVGVGTLAAKEALRR